MSKIVQFHADFYDLGQVKFAAEQYYPLNSETQSLIASGYAAQIDSDDGVDHAGKLQALADMAKARSDSALDHALALAAEADAAQSLATAARLGDDAKKPAQKAEPAPKGKPVAKADVEPVALADGDAAVVPEASAETPADAAAEVQPDGDTAQQS